MCDWVSTRLKTQFGTVFGKANVELHFSTLVYSLMAQSCHVAMAKREREREEARERDS